MKVVGNKKLILFICTGLLILYIYILFGENINDFGLACYYTFFHIKIDAFNAMAPIDVFRVLFWQILIAITFGTYMENTVMENAAILFTRSNKRTDIYIYHLKKIIKNVTVYCLIIGLLLALIYRKTDLNGIYFMIFFYMYVIDLALLCNVFSLFWDMKYVLIILFIVQYALWTVISKNDVNNTKSLLGVFLTSSPNIDLSHFVRMTIIFMLLNFTGIYALKRKEGV